MASGGLSSFTSLFSYGLPPLDRTPPRLLAGASSEPQGPELRQGSLQFGRLSVPPEKVIDLCSTKAPLAIPKRDEDLIPDRVPQLLAVDVLRAVEAIPPYLESSLEMDPADRALAIQEGVDARKAHRLSLCPGGDGSEQTGPA
jgi:hypothetical protein